MVTTNISVQELQTMVMVEQFVSVYRITNPQLISDCKRSSYFITFYYQCGNAFELFKIFKI